jgi:hypothetical protein
VRGRIVRGHQTQVLELMKDAYELAKMDGRPRSAASEIVQLLP